METINFLYPEKSDIKFHIDTYPDSQTHLALDQELNLREQLGIVTRLSNLNDIWILMQLADICHRRGVIIAELKIAYLFAARTDRLFSNKEALDLDIVYKCIKFVNAVTTKILEAHSSRIFYLGEKIYPESGIETIVQDSLGISILFPDKGAQERYSDCFFSAILIAAEKHRVSKDKLEVVIPDIISSLLHNPVYVVDDLCDGGGTFFAIHKALEEKGVKEMHLRVVHAIQKEPLIKLAELYKTVTITNSYKDWDKEELPSNIKVIKVYE